MVCFRRRPSSSTTVIPASAHRLYSTAREKGDLTALRLREGIKVTAVQTLLLEAEQTSHQITIIIWQATWTRIRRSETHTHPPAPLHPDSGETTPHTGSPQSHTSRPLGLYTAPPIKPHSRQLPPGPRPSRRHRHLPRQITRPACLQLDSKNYPGHRLDSDPPLNRHNKAFALRTKQGPPSFHMSP